MTRERTSLKPQASSLRPINCREPAYGLPVQAGDSYVTGVSGSSESRHTVTGAGVTLGRGVRSRTDKSQMMVHTRQARRGLGRIRAEAGAGTGGRHGVEPVAIAIAGAESRF